MELSFWQWMFLSFAVVCYGLWELGKGAVKGVANSEAPGHWLRGFFK